jgi:crossover junction endodeoxyribonuclease RusA
MDEHTLTYVIPNVPPSVNACFRSGNKRVYKSKRYIDYEKEMKEYFDKKEYVEMLEGKLKLEVTFYFKDKRRRDLDNLMKALLDQLESRLFKNDDQIYEICSKKVLGCLETKTELTLTGI